MKAFECDYDGDFPPTKNGKRGKCRTMNNSTERCFGLVSGQLKEKWKMEIIKHAPTQNKCSGNHKENCKLQKNIFFSERNK